ncbi:MAG: lipoate--protein ligase [Clostridia bacterium]|nr:lipoate--protein ligase [Clostridia bacterium]
MLFIFNESTDPYFNLAAEEFLVQNLSEEVFMIWRNHNTIVVGRNQNTLSEIHYDYVKEHDIQVVRRMSGGGTVFHDMGNVNFTFIVNSGDDFNNYRRFCEPVIGFLKTLGVTATLSGRNDILVDDKKISGNAQYMYKNRVMHHGTLLYAASQDRISEALKVSEDKIKSKGIKSVRSRVTNIGSHMETPISVEEFVEKFVDYMVKNIPDCKYYDLAQNEAEIRKLREEKYATWEWNYGYSPKYEFVRKKRFDAGCVEVHMDIAGTSEIKDIKFYGDFFSKVPVTELEQKLQGLRHEAGAIEKALEDTDVSQYIAGITKEDFMTLLF